MSGRMNAVSPRKYTTSQGEEKTQWRRVGVAWPSKNGPGYTIKLDCVPAPELSQDGKTLEYVIMLMEPKDNGGGSYQAPTAEDKGDDFGF